MRRLIAFAAALVVNAGLLGALGLNVYLDHAPPAGHVEVTQLDKSEIYAHAASK